MPIPIKVLIVEDSESDAQLVVRLLKKAGYEISHEVVETSAEMRSALQRSSWDIVISDYMLPQFDGPAALKILQESELDIPFISVSGTMGEETAVAMMKAGAHDYLMKDKLARLAPAVERELRDVEVRRKRKMADEALQESKNRLHQMLQTTDQGIYGIDLDGRCTFINNSGLKMLGRELDDCLGTNMHNLIHHSYPDGSPYPINDCPIFRAKLTGAGYRVESEVLWRKDGTSFPAEYSSYPSFENGIIIGAVITFSDITERRRAEEKIREKDIQFRKLSSNLPDLIFQFTRRPDGSYFVPVASEGIRNIFGCSPEDVVDNFDPIGRVIHPDDAVRVISDIEYSAEHLTYFTCEFRVQIPGKPVQWIFSRSSPEKLADGSITWFGFNADITERKLSEQLLAQEKERIAVTLRSIGDAVITTDVNGNIVVLNKSAEEMTGWKTEDAAGRPLPEVLVIINELTREPCANPVERVLSTGSIVELENHTCLISKDGRERVIADSGAPIRDKESRIIGVVLVFRDMTEKQKLNDSMQRAQKLESLGVLAGGIAHDFNNMLAGIFGYLEMSVDSVSAKRYDQTSKYLNKALSVFERAKGLTQQLLTFSKGGTPVRKTLNIAPLVQHSASFALSGSNVTCQFNFADGLWKCDCDENQIGQVIDNIVINAKQAMPLGGTIIVTAENVAHQPGHPGNFVRISIKDQGIGMSAEILARIFDPFFSTKETGHGLGLATVFSIIKRHDGWIDVESKQGKGSTFHLFIPASEKTMSVGAGLDAAEHIGSGTILVMDDEEFMLEIAGAMLREMGYAVALAKDGEEALAFFTHAEKSGRPHFASILDLTIPGGMGGKETAAAIRKINPKSIIVASSGYSEDPVMSNPTDHGFSERIIKPYRKKELTELMVRITELS